MDKETGAACFHLNGNIKEIKLLNTHIPCMTMLNFKKSYGHVIVISLHAKRQCYCRRITLTTAMTYCTEIKYIIQNTVESEYHN